MKIKRKKMKFFALQLSLILVLSAMSYAIPVNAASLAEESESLTPEGADQTSDSSQAEEKSGAEEEQSNKETGTKETETETETGTKETESETETGTKETESEEIGIKTFAVRRMVSLAAEDTDTSVVQISDFEEFEAAMAAVKEKEKTLQEGESMPLQIIELLSDNELQTSAQIGTASIFVGVGSKCNLEIRSKEGYHYTIRPANASAAQVTLFNVGSSSFRLKDVTLDCRGSKENLRKAIFMFALNSDGELVLDDTCITVKYLTE